MPRRRAVPPAAVLLLAFQCLACDAGGGGPGDPGTDLRDLPGDVAPDVDAADGTGPGDPGDPRDAPAFDPGTMPTCCTDALCAALQGTCDPATCRCVPAAGGCCTDASCGPAGMACDPGTCRCVRVPCTEAGAPCDPSRMPGAGGRPVCTATSAGLFCMGHMQGWGGCPGGACGAWDDNGCSCGWTGCMPFQDDCDGGLACLAGDWPPLTTGTCGVAGTAAEGQSCTERGQCAPGLACATTCQRIECGLAPGAPTCPAGLACRPLDAWGVIGTCRVPCDPFDPVSPCGADQWCRAPCAYLEPAPFCGGVDAPPYGLAGGWCVDASDRVVGPGEDCTTLPCGPGTLCEGSRCREACPAGLPPGTARGTAACAAGLECAVTTVGWPVSVAAGVCATPCDPFAAVPDMACDPLETCRLSAFASPSLGHCLTRPWQVARPGEYCYDGGLPCEAGYACASLGPRRAVRCVAACRADAAPGGPGACPDGQRCFRNYDSEAGAWAPWGACGVPCDPYAAEGASGCDPTTTCEARDRDPATGRLVGLCFDRDSGAEGQPCTSPEPGIHPGCAPGLVCRPEGGDARCRRRCDVQWSRTGQGACPAGWACQRAWPPTGDPVMGGCVAE